MTKIPSKVDGPDTVGLGYWPHQVNAMLLKELQKSHNQLIDYITAREELEDARYKDITSRLGVISKNQLEMKRGKRCPEEDFGFEPKDQPKRWPQKGDLIYCFNSRGDILEQRWNETAKLKNGEMTVLSYGYLSQAVTEAVSEERDTAYTLLRTLIAGKEKKAPLWESDERGYNQALDDILTLLDHIYGKTDALTTLTQKT